MKVCIYLIDDECVKDDLNVGKVVIIMGFQGVDLDGYIMMLGWGGFDMLVVVVVVVLGVEECLIYIDVDGVYMIDLCVVEEVCCFDCVMFEEMLEMVSFGLKVLQICLVEFVGKYQVKMCVLLSLIDLLIVFDEEMCLGILIIFEEDEIMEKVVIFGIVFQCDEVCIVVMGVFDKLGIVYQIFGLVVDVNVDVDMIIQNQSVEGKIDFMFMVGCGDYQKVMDIFINQVQGYVSVECVQGDLKVLKVLVVGVGMWLYVGVVSKMFCMLLEEGINIQMILMFEIKILVLIDEKYMELVVCVLYKVFEFDQVL